MPRYIDADKLCTRERGNNSQRTMWREIKRIVDDAPTVEVVPKSEVLKEYREKVYCKMEKHTIFGREYIQRIMREVEKEMVGDRTDENTKRT